MHFLPVYNALPLPVLTEVKALPVSLFLTLPVSLKVSRLKNESCGSTQSCTGYLILAIAEKAYPSIWKAISAPDASLFTTVLYRIYTFM